jgi:hypothetical protein
VETIKKNFMDPTMFPLFTRQLHKKWQILK